MALSRRRIATVLGVALLTLALLELSLVAVRRLPALWSVAPLRTLARELYLLDRRTIQYEERAARWDERLGYLLRSGDFEFANTEYRTRYAVNRLGVRDDKASLEAPGIVVIGDSFAMGWGVDQDEAFPEVLQRMSGLRVLNTAVASFGTARELRLLEQVDLSSASHLVIQFCNNDYFENLAFRREGPGFAVQDEAGYAAAAADYRRGRRYYPGRYTLDLLRARLGLVEQPEHPDPADPASQRLQAELFLEVLIGSAVDLSGLDIVVFEINAHNRHAGLFIPALREVIANGDYPEWIERMTVVDLAAELTPEQFFEVDDHITADGHRRLAERLHKIIGPHPPAE